ncbi:hypothetical protein QYF36_021814 [Acer negundo]|nr:hypothetical protein QYF36_021814 [Acer negundo]
MTLLCLFIISVLLHFTPLSQFMENEPATAAESSTTATVLLPLDPVEEALSPSWPLMDDENVVAMTEKSYADYMDKKRGVVLFFYDSNCPTCRKLAPEYSAAAEMLKGDEAVTFGMLDAYESARKFFIPRYPTMCSIFPKGRLSYYDFQEMESTRDSIITWVKRMITVGIYSITKMEDAQRIFNAETHLVLGFLDDLEVWLLAPPDDNSDEIISTFNKVQDTLKETIPAKVAPSFVYMKMNFGEAGRLIISDDLEISEQVPIIIAYTGSADGEKYILNRELTFDNIKTKFQASRRQMQFQRHFLDFPQDF